MATHSNYTRVVLFICAFMCALQASAQKLPNVQTAGQWLPDTAKVDGKLTEWDDRLKAHNNATGVDYLIANNADQLYIAFKSADKGITAKIMAGGITFTINTSGKKKATGSSITVPLTNSDYTPTEGGGLRQNFSILTDSVTITGAIRNLKDIKVLNFKGVKDTILSIYNEYEIKTRVVYDGVALICEVMIPRAMIGLGDASTAFAYQVKLNGVPFPNFAGSVPPPPPGRLPSSVMYISGEIRSVTDFWGEYTLAKNL